MPEEHHFSISPDGYLGQLQQSLARHMADLRNTLRSLEEGSFTERANTPRQNAVIRLQLTPFPGRDIGEASVAACNGCFLDLTRAMIEYLDRMIAVKRCIRQRIRIPRALHSTAELNAFIDGLLNQHYERVSRNRSLTNPRKIAEFPTLADLPRRAALSYFSIRRTLEHYAGEAREDLHLISINLTVLADDRAIVVLPQVLAEGTQLSLQINDVAKMFIRGSRITLTEEDVEGVFLTIQHIIMPEVRHALAA